MQSNTPKLGTCGTEENQSLRTSRDILRTRLRELKASDNYASEWPAADCHCMISTDVHRVISPTARQ